jgi:serine/threonine protein kinase
MPRVGEIVAGKYRLDGLIGQGAFASVWAATNVNLDRPVALKILTEAQARKKTTVARFLKEAKLCATPIHPVIVTVQDIGQTEEGLPFLVMELLQGHTLDRILRKKGPLPWSMVLEVARAVLEGLAAAHERDIIHRDIKPSNLFLLRSAELGPQVRLLDLGLARDLTDDNRLTHTGQVVGTANYLPPETLLDEQPKGGTKRGDVFALGMVMFVSLTGRFPFIAERIGAHPAAEVYARAEFYKSRRPLHGPRLYEPSVPGPLDELVQRALSIETSSRFRDAGEMLAALDEVVERLASFAPRESFTGGESLKQTSIDAVEPILDGELEDESEQRLRAAMAWEALLDFTSVRDSLPPPELGSLAGAAPDRVSRPSDHASRPSDRASRPSHRASRPSLRLKKGVKKRLQLVFVGAGAGALVGVMVLALLTGLILWWRGRALVDGEGDAAVIEGGDSSFIELVGLPPGARVRLDGREVIGTTLERHLGAPGLLEIEAPGYSSLRLRLDERSGSILDVGQRLSRSRDAAAELRSE